MPTNPKQLDLTVLSPSARREMRDFYQFLLSRQSKQPRRSSLTAKSNGFTELCGKLSWKGDAVAIQRSIRDEW
jgi:hypothetical protein